MINYSLEEKGEGVARVKGTRLGKGRKKGREGCKGLVEEGRGDVRVCRWADEVCVYVYVCACVFV